MKSFLAQMDISTELKSIYWKELLKKVKLNMRIIIFLTLSFGFLLPIKTFASSSSNVSEACNRFTSGKVDAYKTLDALDLNTEDYSIGINNTAKIFCFL